MAYAHDTDVTRIRRRNEIDDNFFFEDTLVWIVMGRLQWTERRSPYSPGRV